MADYYIDIVNENDEVVGKELKSKKLEKEFISRVIAVFLLDSEKKFLMCRRAPHKSDAPNLWDLAVCGNVESGESYKEAARRELSEELGISCELESLGKFYEENKATSGSLLKVFCGIFIGYTDEEPTLSEELTESRKMTLDEIKSEITSSPEKFCNGFRTDFENVKEKLKSMINK